MSEINSVTNKEYRDFLKSVGCYKKRQKGSHLVFSKDGLRRPIIFQATGDIPLLHIKTNLKTLGITTEVFLDHIKSVRSKKQKKAKN